MTTEREYREWQKRRQLYRQKRQKKKNNFTFLWIIIILISAFIACRNNPEFLQKINLDSWNKILDSVKLKVNSLKSVTEEFVTEIDEPIVIGDETKVVNNNFNQIDQLALKITYQGNSVDELAQILSQYANTDLEKARLIYSWITNNITYDVGALSALFNQNIYPDISTHQVLTTRSTICSGYANLYQKLAEKMGLKSLIILGYAKGVNYIVGEDNNINHAWNGVKINEKWYLIDTTWGAGIVENNTFQPLFNPHYFATNPDEFIYSHFPENSQWQLLSIPYTRAEFDNLVTVSPTLFENNIELISHKNNNIDSDGNLKITLKAPQNIVVIAKVQSDNETLSDNYTFVQKESNYINIYAAFPTKGNYKLDIFAKPKDNNNRYPLITSYEVNASNQGEKFPLVYQHFNENNGYLQSPLKQQLPTQGNIYFKLRIDNATEVKVLNKSTDNWTDLTRYGNLYAGNVKAGKDKMVVFAKFPGDSRYWALLEYN